MCPNCYSVLKTALRFWITAFFPQLLFYLDYPHWNIWPFKSRLNSNWASGHSFHRFCSSWMRLSCICVGSVSHQFEICHSHSKDLGWDKTGDRHCNNNQFLDTFLGKFSTLEHKAFKTVFKLNLVLKKSIRIWFWNKC